MIAQVYGAVVLGVKAFMVRVEVAVYPGLPGFSLVGLPSASVREARERVFSAIRAAGFKVPTQRMVVNLAPADLRKEGTQLDLPIALGLLAASGQIETTVWEGVVCAGELSLEGHVRAVSCIPAIARSMVSICIDTQQKEEKSFQLLVCPWDNQNQVEWFKGLHYIPLKHLKDLSDESVLKPIQSAGMHVVNRYASMDADLSDVHGQERGKQALLVAAAGGHSMLMAGSPGCGKSMLAQRLPSILPSLTPKEALEVSVIHGVAGAEGSHPIYTSPYRAPHHSVSRAALIGGGASPRLGEITLAHRGVLFLDELAEFDRIVLEALRQPMQDKIVHLSRNGWQADMPAHFQLIAAFNPCPCGNLLDTNRTCRCHPSAVTKYLSRVSGPLLDRVDIQIEMLHDGEEEGVDRNRWSSEKLREKVVEARNRMSFRAKIMEWDIDTYTKNAELKSSHIAQMLSQYASLGRTLRMLSKHHHMSMRARDSVLKLSLTLADLAGREIPKEEDLLTAVQMRALDLTLKLERKETPFQKLIHQNVEAF